MAISGKGVRPPTLDDIPSVTTLPGARLAGLRPPPVHILVIEDHDDTRDVLDMLLRTEGYEVTLAVDGQDGLEKYRRRPPDIVLVDIVLGSESGFDLARKLTAATGPPRAAVILISTYSEEDFMDLIVASPAIGFLPKGKLSARAIEDLLGEREEGGKRS